ncbi:MAG TPA: CBS domain-containing protein [Thermoanaerobaculia bacterium]|nr:CBS domain-containing protein [Thermoanaerobaculia bacterium]
MSAASCVRFDESARETLEKMRTVGAQYAIVTSDKDIIGVLSREELATATADNPALINGQVATPVPTLTPEAELKDAANIMRSEGVSCVPVTDGTTIAGIVTIERLLELIGQGAVRPRIRRERRDVKGRAPVHKPVSESSIRLRRRRRSK